jgi:hypothetical protein
MPRFRREPHDAGADAGTSTARGGRRTARSTAAAVDPAPRVGGVGAADLLALQRTVGNRAVQRLLAAGALRPASRRGGAAGATRGALELALGASEDAVPRVGRRPAGPSQTIRRLMSVAAFIDASDSLFAGKRNKVLTIDQALQQFHATRSATRAGDVQKYQGVINVCDNYLALPPNTTNETRRSGVRVLRQQAINEGNVVAARVTDANSTPERRRPVRL